MKNIIKKYVVKHVFFLGGTKKKSDICITNLKQSFLP